MTLKLEDWKYTKSTAAVRTDLKVVVTLILQPQSPFALERLEKLIFI